MISLIFVSNVVSKLKEDVLSNGTTNSYNLLELDLTNAYYEINNSRNNIIIVFEVENDISPSDLNYVFNNNFFEIYAEVLENKGISNSTKVDEYKLDNKAKVLIKRSDGDIFYNIDLISTLHKKYPLSLSLVGGGKESNANDILFPFNSRLNIQCKFRKNTNEDGLKEIFTYNIFGNKERFGLKNETCITGSRIRIYNATFPYS